MPAFDLSKIQSVKQTIHSDLIVSMSGATSADLLSLGFNILRGIENEDKIIVYKGNRQMATRYAVNQTSRSRLGTPYERVLKVTNDIVYVPDNVQNYREKIVGSMLGVSSNGLSTDNIELRLRLQAAQFGSHIIDNVFHGDKSKTINDYFGLYDGILVKIENDKSEGLIDVASGNLVNVGRLDTKDAKACYEAYVLFCEKMNSTLRKNCIIVTNEKVYNAIVRGYALTFIGNQQNIIGAMGANEFVSHETGGCKLRKTTLLGDGDGFIAYAPGNMDYGTDLTGAEDPNSAYISIQADPSDFLNSILIGMQCASATRVRDFNKEAFCISDYNFTAPSVVADKPEIVTSPNEDIVKNLIKRIEELEKASV